MLWRKSVRPAEPSLMKWISQTSRRVPLHMVSKPAQLCEFLHPFLLNNWQEGPEGRHFHFLLKWQRYSEEQNTTKTQLFCWLKMDGWCMMRQTTYCPQNKENLSWFITALLKPVTLFPCNNFWYSQKIVTLVQNRMSCYSQVRRSF